MRHDFVQPCLEEQYFFGMDLDIRGLALKTTHRLMDHHARIRQAITLALGACGQQQGTHTGRLAHAQGRHIRLDELHGVVDRQTRRHRSTGRVDIEKNIFFRVLGFEKQQLGHDQIGRDFIHRPHQKHHPLLEQTRVDVIGALTATALLDHHRHHAQRLCIQRTSVRSALPA